MIVIIIKMTFHLENLKTKFIFEVKHKIRFKKVKIEIKRKEKFFNKKNITEKSLFIIDF